MTPSQHPNTPEQERQFLEPVTVTFATIKEAQAAFLACERLRVAGRWPGQDWARAGHEAELVIHYALKELDAHDF